MTNQANPKANNERDSNRSAKENDSKNQPSNKATASKQGNASNEKSDSKNQPRSNKQ